MRWSIWAILIGTASTPCHALCSYNNVLYAKTTIRQEFADSRWVVRAKVISARDGFVERGKPDAGAPYTTYTLHLVKAYKGQPPSQFTFYTQRNSGGFYMDRPWVPLQQSHDVGGEYLLFLNPNKAYPGQPKAERGTVFVNYSCGQSREWSDVTGQEQRLLSSLAGNRAKRSRR
jgi:hypothetical protein